MITNTYDTTCNNTINANKTSPWTVNYVNTNRNASDYVSDLSKYKWSQVHRDSFRANLIGQLPILNQLTSFIERSQTCINTVVSSFTNVIKILLRTIFENH